MKIMSKKLKKQYEIGPNTNLFPITYKIPIKYTNNKGEITEYNIEDTDTLWNSIHTINNIKEDNKNFLLKHASTMSYNTREIKTDKMCFIFDLSMDHTSSDTFMKKNEAEFKENMTIIYILMIKPNDKNYYKFLVNKILRPDTFHILLSEDSNFHDTLLINDDIICVYNTKNIPNDTYYKRIICHDSSRRFKENIFEFSSNDEIKKFRIFKNNIVAYDEKSNEISL